jgi:hypothetical protein
MVDEVLMRTGSATISEKIHSGSSLQLEKKTLCYSLSEYLKILTSRSSAAYTSIGGNGVSLKLHSKQIIKQQTSH